MQAGLSFETFILNKLAEGDTDVLRLSMVIDDGRTTMLSRVLTGTDGPIDPVGLYDYIRIGLSASTDIQKLRALSSIIIKKNITVPPDSTRCFDGLGFRSSM
jgi:hypothetical protein